MSLQPFTLRQLVLYFLQLGLTGFGGPVALVGYMQRDLVERRKWFSREDYLHGVALAQLVPGPLAMQTAIYFGYLKGKIAGATLVALAFVFFPFLLIWGLGWIYLKYQGLGWIQAVFYGMGAAVIGVIARAAVNLAKISLQKQWELWLVFLVVGALTAATGRLNLFFFLGSGALMALLFFVRKTFSATRTFSLPIDLGLFFMKAAVIVYGSGIAIIPFIHHDVTQGYQWLNNREFMDAVAVGMLTPGPALITVGFIGYLVDGFWGALSSTVGIFIPVYLFVILFVPFFRRLVRLPAVKAFVDGVTAAAAGAIAGAVWILGNKAVVDWPTAGLAAGVFILLCATRLPAPLLLLIGGILGFAMKSTGG